MDTIKGLDVSQHNQKINWKLIKEHEIKFVFIKATEGNYFTDGFYERNFEEALYNKIHVAPYHFISPRSNPIEQANFFCRKLIKNTDDLLLTPVLDIEWDFKRNIDQWLSINRLERIDFIFVIINIIEDKIGRKPIIYTSKGFWDEKIAIKDTIIKDYPLWISDYSIRLEPRLPRDWDSWTFWQYFDKYRIGSKTFDVNKYNIKSNCFNKLINKE